MNNDDLGETKVLGVRASPSPLLPSSPLLDAHFSCVHYAIQPSSPFASPSLFFLLNPEILSFRAGKCLKNDRVYQDEKLQKKKKNHHKKGRKEAKSSGASGEEEKMLVVHGMKSICHKLASFTRSSVTYARLTCTRITVCQFFFTPMCTNLHSSCYVVLRQSPSDHQDELSSILPPPPPCGEPARPGPDSVSTTQVPVVCGG